MLPYGRQSISEADIDAVVKVLRGDWLTTGPAVDAFEVRISAAAGGGHAVSVTSGTAALHTAYAAAGIGPGDVVITTPMTFVATAATAMQLGATVHFADVESDTGNLDLEAVEAAWTPRTRILTAVDFAGVPAQPDRMADFAHSRDALFVEDAAHSIGSTWNGRPVGSFADVTTFSFFPTKNLTTAEGGAVVTQSDALAARARAFKNHGLVRDRDAQRWPDEGPWHQEVHSLGLNYRLPDVLAALGSSQMQRLSTFANRRAQIRTRYDEGLRDLPEVRLPPSRPEAHPMWHLYPLRVLEGRRRELYDSLRRQGIGVQVNYMPVYWHPVFADIGYKRGLCPRAEVFYSEELSLPMFADLSDSQIDTVIDAIRTFFSA